MIIEGAFLKIPEVLAQYNNPEELYESNITNLLTNGIILELNARNIDNPLMKIQMEKRYKEYINTRCDIYVDFSSFMKEINLNKYGFYSENWIEAKYFGGINRNKGNETKSENAGSIMYDLYRLIKNTHAGKNERGLYSLNIFNESPNKYLAFSRNNKSKRDWIESLLKTGIQELQFSLQDEPKTMINIFKNVTQLEMNLKIKCLSFYPLLKVNLDEKGFYGYLIQILEYNLIEDGNVYKSDQD